MCLCDSLSCLKTICFLALCIGQNNAQGIVRDWRDMIIQRKSIMEPGMESVDYLARRAYDRQYELKYDGRSILWRSPMSFMTWLKNLVLVDDPEHISLLFSRHQDSAMRFGSRQEILDYLTELGSRLSMGEGDHLDWHIEHIKKKQES